MGFKFWNRFRSNETCVSETDLKLVKEINKEFDLLKAVSDSTIKSNFQRLRDLTQSLDREDLTVPDNRLIIQGFANIKQASWRAIQMAHHDVQLLAGIVMVRGNIAEMATGEGKTLVATLPASLFALWGKGVHVMTVNAYLAKRDYEIMMPVYQFLGLTADYIATRMPDNEKAKAYRADITYGVGNDFGFDYLRDQLKLQRQPIPKIGASYQSRLRGISVSKQKLTQCGHAFAVIDEADSVMIDEASSALILSAASGAPHPRPDPYHLATKVANQLEEYIHFKVEENSRTVHFTSEGVREMQHQLDRSTRANLIRPWETYVANALRAFYLFTLDIDYLVLDDTIQIVDTFTGRRFEDRSWSEGLHQAVESKEQVTITEESQSMLKISRHQFFQLYRQRCGMTGTAIGCEKEFEEIFDLGVKRIPLHRTSERQYLPLAFYETNEEKLEALIAKINQFHHAGVPVLVGTQSVQESEELVKRLHLNDMESNVLNARNDEEEAELVAEAGKWRAITVATNMAGRGTDIPIAPRVKDLGGLFVILTEPNRSRRIDRQLIGRCARQGDPGTAIIFSCKEDSIFKSTRGLKWINLKNENGWKVQEISKYIISVQRQNDINDFQNRLDMMSHSQWKEGVISKLTGKLDVD